MNRFTTLHKRWCVKSYIVHVYRMCRDCYGHQRTNGHSQNIENVHVAKYFVVVSLEESWKSWRFLTTGGRPWLPLFWPSSSGSGWPRSGRRTWPRGGCRSPQYSRRIQKNCSTTLHNPIKSRWWVRRSDHLIVLYHSFTGIFSRISRYNTNLIYATVPFQYFSVVKDITEPIPEQKLSNGKTYTVDIKFSISKLHLMG